MVTLCIKRAVALLLCAVFGLPAFGADRYVRFNAVGMEPAGVDSASGSISSPWKHAPGDNNATGNAAAFVPAAGDTIFFYAGATYVGTVRFMWSGTGAGANPITYDGDSWGVAGQRSTNTTQFAPNTSAFQTTGSNVRSNIVVKGFWIHQVGGWPYNHAVFSGAANSITKDIGRARFGAGVNMLSPSSYITVTNCVFKELGHNTNVIQNASGESVAGAGVVFEGATNNLVINSRFAQVTHPIKMAAAPNRKARGNRFVNNDIATNINWGINFTADATGASFISNQVVGGFIGDMQQFDDVNWLGGGEEPHTDHISHFNNNNGFDVHYEGHLIDGVHMFTDNPLPGGGTAGLWVSRGPSMTIQNCSYVNIKQPYAISIAWPVPINQSQDQEIVIQYCTFVNNGLRISGEPDLVANPSEPLPRRSVWIRNNIFYRTSGNFRAILVENHVDNLAQLDANAYFHTTIAQNSWTATQIVGVNRNFPQLQAAGYEAAGMWGNPMFTSLTPPNKTVDLKPMAGSPVIGKGFNHTNMAAFDRQRVSRVGKPNTLGAVVAGEDIAVDEDPPLPDPLTWVVDPQVIANDPVDGATIEMQWVTATDDSAVSYTVLELTGNPGCNGTSALTSTTHYDTGVPPDTTCTYAVFATDESGNSSTVQSVEKSITTPAVSEPPDVQIDVATAVNLNVIAVPVSPLVTNLFYTDAEESGLPTNWERSGSNVDFDYGSEVYQGLHSILLPDTIEFVHATTTFNAQTGSMSVSGVVRRNSIGATPRKMISIMDSGSEKASVSMGTTGLTFAHGSQSALASKSLAANNWYHFRLKYTPGSGANGFMAVWVNDSAVFSTGSSNTITSGTSTGGYNQFRIEHPASLPGNRFIFDNLLGTVADQPDNPTP